MAATVIDSRIFGSRLVSAEVSGNLLKQLPDAVGRDGDAEPGALKQSCWVCWVLLWKAHVKM